MTHSDSRDFIRHRSYSLAVLLALVLLTATTWPAIAGEEKTSATEARLAKTVEFLADDAMQGRGLGTKGLDRSANYISREFRQIGLKTDLCRGGPFQTFAVRVRSKKRQRIDWWSIFAQAGVKSTDGKSSDDAKLSRKTKTLGRVPGSEPSEGPGILADSPTASKPTNPKLRVAKIKNVIAALDGEGPLAEQTIVLGAHYDHLGVEHDEDGKPVVYNGANDNASGTAALIEVARILKARKKKLPRRIVFIAFSGEEHGLLGSLHYTAHPLIPLDKTIAMINLDMVGRLEGNRLMAAGTGSSPAMAKTADSLAKKYGLHLLPIPGRIACSDHAPFYSHGIPIIFFCTTGGLRDYHRPSDDAEKINYQGIRRVAQLTADLTVALAEEEKPPQFVNEGIQSTLLRGAIKFFGQAAKEAITEQPKPEADAPK